MTVEEIQAKKAAILTYIGRGMDFDRSCALAKVPKEIAKELEADTEFQAYCSEQETLLEFTLLEKVTDMGIKRGPMETSIESRWLLERINPKRWARGGAAGESSAGYAVPEAYRNV